MDWDQEDIQEQEWKNIIEVVEEVFHLSQK